MTALLDCTKEKISSKSLKNVLFLKKFLKKSFTYPPSTLQTALQLKVTHPFDTKDAHNFGPYMRKRFSVRKIIIKCTKHGLHFTRVPQQEQLYLI